LLCGERGSRNAVTATYSYDRADRISSAGATSYTVNANGNLTARGSDSFSYDQANRLTGTTVGSVTASYAYDGAGKRATKTVGSTATNYVYDVNRGLPVLLEDGTQRYVWGLGLAYAVESGAALVYHVDGLGSVRAITNGSAAVVQTYESDEFGIPLSAQGGSAQPFGFTGEQRDPESGFVYLRARFYDSALGRFTSRDPLAGLTSAPQSLNRSAYALNSPVSWTDPSGQKARVNQVPVPWPLPPVRPLPAPTVEVPPTIVVPGEVRQQQQVTGCPGSSENSFIREVNGFLVLVRGPEGGPRNCHVNVQAVPTVNYHVTYEDGYFFSNGSLVSSSAWGTAFALTAQIATAVGDPEQSQLGGLYTAVVAALEALVLLVSGR
jgi:RHS repeat-associated protein